MGCQPGGRALTGLPSCSRAGVGHPARSNKRWTRAVRVSLSRSHWLSSQSSSIGVSRIWRGGRRRTLVVIPTWYYQRRGSTALMAFGSTIGAMQITLRINISDNHLARLDSEAAELGLCRCEYLIKLFSELEDARHPAPQLEPDDLPIVLDS